MTRIKFIRVDYYDGKVIPICFWGNNGEYYYIDEVKSIRKVVDNFEIVYLECVSKLIRDRKKRKKIQKPKGN